MEHKAAKLFIGRWAPFHKGHQYIVDSFLNRGHWVCIAVRDTPVEQDLMTADARVDIIRRIYEGKPVTVFKIPDIDQVVIGRDVGYAIAEVPEEIATISGTEIRQGIIKEATDRMLKGITGDSDNEV